MPSLLLVEDDDKVQRLYKFAFEAEGFQVVTAPNGAEALLRVDDRLANEGTPFDAIVLDMMMMGMSGLDFLQSFNRNTNGGTKVVVLTNIDNPSISRRALALGALEYLNKSNYDPQEVVEHIKRLLNPK